MQGFRGLLGKVVQSDDICRPIMAKVDDQRKSIQVGIEYFHMVCKVFNTYWGQLDKSTNNENQMPQYYQSLIGVFKSYNSQLKSFSDTIYGTFKEMTNLCNTALAQNSNKLKQLQQYIDEYRTQEAMLVEMGKKYFRSLRNIQPSIQSYKASFADVKLIYNSDEKLRRYNACFNDYQSISEEYQHIAKKVQNMNIIKDNIVGCYDSIFEDYKRMIQIISTRQITQCKNFSNCYSLLHKKIFTLVVEYKIKISNIPLTSIFYKLPLKQPQYFTCQINPDAYKSCPPLLYYHSYLRDQYLNSYSRALVDFIRQITDRAQQRKILNRSIMQFQQRIIKVIDKTFLTSLRQSIIYFEKNKRQLGELFGKKFASFINSISCVLETALGINQKLLKSITNRLVNTQAYINDDIKIVDMLLKELNNNIQKIIGKQQLKRIKSSNNNKQEFIADINKYRQEISLKAEFFINLIQAYSQKIDINYHKISQSYNDTINDIFISNNQLYTLTLEYQSKYFGNQEFQIKFKMVENDLQTIFKQQKQFYANILLGKMLNDKSKIVFDGQIHKFQSFKKLKKPLEFKSEKDQDIPKQSQILSQFNASEIQQVKLNGNHSFQSEKDLSISRKSSLALNKTTVVEPKNAKHAKRLQFLLERVIFEDGEELKKTYRCALSDKIILSGRLFITTQRFCFYSNFNANNLFFGETFIQVPKKDIIKIQKRTTAVFFNNSISITTVNGQIYLTSFLRREQAFAALCKNLQINQNYAFQQLEDIVQDDSKDNLLIEQKDDMLEEQIPKRQQQIQPLLTQFPFKQLFTTEIQFPDLTAYIVFKLFYCWQQITINRRKYKSFLHFIREGNNHTDMAVEEWKPNLYDYMNIKNIKSNSPLQFCLTLNQTIPVPDSGIPFMPKTSKSNELQKVWIYSKDKIKFQSRFITRGVPYAETFEVYLRTTMSTKALSNFDIYTDKCQFKYQIHVHFLKKTIASSMIESSAIENSTKGMRNHIDQIKKYFKNSIKKPKPQINKELNNQKLNANQQLENQISQLGLQIDKLNKQLKTQKYEKEKNKNFLIGSIILNLLLFIILLS